jgi:DNA repair protein RadB
VEEAQKVSTGSDAMDSLLKGGLERGVITNFYGGSATGKTNLCVEAAAEQASRNQEVLYIDTEGGFSTERFAQVGDEEDLENVELSEPSTFDNQEDAVNEASERADEVDLIVVDSLVALYRLEATGDDIPEANQRLSSMLASLSKAARENNIPVVVTNQVYSRFDKDGVELAGRDVPRYWCKCLIELTNDSGRKARIERHRSLPPDRSVRLEITDDGIVEQKEESGGVF